MQYDSEFDGLNESMTSVIDLDENNFKHGILGLVISLVEIIRDTLRLQAFKRMEGGSLTEDEIERLGEALLDLDTALDQIKQEHGIADAVQQVRDGLDDVVDEVLNKMLNPERWADEGNPQSEFRNPQSIGR